MANTWWKNAVIYGVDVERFCDGNGDGIGDFQGLTSKLPYLAELGVTCVWLLPFFPSTNLDNGYDIADHYRVDSRYGPFEDFLDFVRATGEQGIRVVVDLVVHHTAVNHPWFQSARHDGSSPFRDYYIWSDHPPPPTPGGGTMFPGQEDSVWTYDEVAQSYYYHRFYSFQPSLNHRNPAVVDEIKRIMDFWMSLGISGFRVDAASHLIEDPLDPDGRSDPNHSILRQLYAHATQRVPDPVMLGEVDEDERTLKTFFDGEQLNMMFNFFLDNYLLLALADGSAEPIREALARMPPPPANGQWANFLRNLDEADLERLTPEQRARVLDRFAPKEEMRIYGRGIRRRLAPMLGDDRQLRMAYSLLFSMPGAPVICYGDEIGMGDDLNSSGRNAVRAPMQWSARRNGSFSKASPDKMAQPPIEKGPFGYPKVNVEEQRHNDASLFALVKKLAHIRRSHRALGDYDCQIMHSNADPVLAHAYQGPEHEIVILHNLGARRETVRLELDAVTSHEPQVLLGRPSEAPVDGCLQVDLEPYEFRWLLWDR